MLKLTNTLTGKQEVFEPADGQTPEKSFERRWAITVLDQVLQRLREDMSATTRRNCSSS